MIYDFDLRLDIKDFKPNTVQFGEYEEEDFYIIAEMEPEDLSFDHAFGREKQVSYKLKSLKIFPKANDNVDHAKHLTETAVSNIEKYILKTFL